jgi:hypothetical protein
MVCPGWLDAYQFAGDAQTRFVIVSSSVWCLVTVVDPRALETLLAGPLLERFL